MNLILMMKDNSKRARYMDRPQSLKLPSSPSELNEKVTMLHKFTFSEIRFINKMILFLSGE